MCFCRWHVWPFLNEVPGLDVRFLFRYTDRKGQEAYAAVTQFEATDARRCFPCWDEPALKATFDTTLVVPKELVALSNMVSADFALANKKKQKRNQMPSCSHAGICLRNESSLFKELLTIFASVFRGSCDRLQLTW